MKTVGSPPHLSQPVSGQPEPGLSEEDQSGEREALQAEFYLLLPPGDSRRLPLSPSGTPGQW